LLRGAEEDVIPGVERRELWMKTLLPLSDAPTKVASGAAAATAGVGAAPRPSAAATATATRLDRTHRPASNLPPPPIARSRSTSPTD
jgi:hypothetical protein